MHHVVFILSKIKWEKIEAEKKNKVKYLEFMYSYKYLEFMYCYQYLEFLFSYKYLGFMF